MSLLDQIRAIFDGVTTQEQVFDIDKNERKAMDKRVLRRAAEIAVEMGGHEGGFNGNSAEGEVVAERLGLWAEQKYPDDATAVGWWDSFVWAEMDEDDFANYTPGPCADSQTWSTIAANGPEEFLPESLKVPDLELDWTEEVRIAGESGDEAVVRTMLTEKFLDPLLARTEGDVVKAAKLANDALIILKRPASRAAGQAGDRLWNAGVRSMWDLPTLIREMAVKSADKLLSFVNKPHFVRMFVCQLWWAMPEKLGPNQAWEMAVQRNRADDAILVARYFDLRPDNVPAETPKWSAALRECVERVTGKRTKKRKREAEYDEEESKRHRNLTVTEEKRVPHSGAKNLDSDIFQLVEGAAPSDIDVHDPKAFGLARADQLGATDAVKACGGRFNDTNHWLAVYRGEEMRPGIDQAGCDNMRMGHEAEPVALDDFEEAFPGTEPIGSKFYRIPGTAYVITPDDVLPKEKAGEALAKYFDDPFPPIQSLEVKSHRAGLKDPEPKKTRRGETYYPHSATYIQGLLQCLAVNGWNKVPEGVVPGFFLIDHHPDSKQTRVWHITFPEPSFATTLLEHLDAFHKALMADEAPTLEEPDLPFETVTFTRIH
jgi:hypothetical protein